MSASEHLSVGFLSVHEIAELGAVGGYLILNAVGRPLEFHCTTPVRANRAQEILYGTTLRPVLYGEQIATALCRKQKSQPRFLLTDNEFVAAVRMNVELPTALLLADSAALPNPALWVEMNIGDYRLAIWKRYAQDEPIITAAIDEQLGHLDLTEPFGRIHEALEETQKSVRPAAA